MRTLARSRKQRRPPKPNNMGGRSGQTARAPGGVPSYSAAISINITDNTGANSISEMDARRFAAAAGIPADFDGFIRVEKSTRGSVFVGVNDENITMQRVIDGDTIENAYFRITGAKYKGRGSEIFAAQINAARAQGFKTIRVNAAGDARSARGNRGYNGYYTWLRFGYVPDNNRTHPALQRINQILETRARRRFSSVTDLMKTADGRALWNESGSGFLGKFDLSPDSYSSKTLAAYIRERRRAGGN